MRRTKQLVSQYLENISRKVLEKYPQLFRAHTRKRHGIYALYRKERLCYVGLASNLRSRLRHHLSDRHSETWDRFSIYFTIGDDHLRELEALAIRIASPRENRQKGNLVRAGDLKPVLRLEIAKFQRAEQEELFGDTSEKHLLKIARKIVEQEGRKSTLAPYIKSSFHNGFPLM